MLLSLVGLDGYSIKTRRLPIGWRGRTWAQRLAAQHIDSFVSEVAIPPVSQTQTALGVPDLSPPLREDVRDIDGLAAQGADPP